VEGGARRYDLSGMRALSLFALLLTMLTLPLYGLAGVAQRSCQEEMRTSSSITLVGDCCPGKSDPGTLCKRLGDHPLHKKGSCTACKAGANCKSPQPYEPAAALVWTVPAAHSTVWKEPPSRLSSHSPEGLWRPPRLT
jgi:hypothetical protein